MHKYIVVSMRNMIIFYESDILHKVSVCNMLGHGNITVIYRDTNWDVTTAMYKITSANLRRWMIVFLYLMCTPIHTKYGICLSFRLEMSCLHGFHTFTLSDNKWPLTFTKNTQYGTKLYEICPSFPSSKYCVSQCDPCWPHVTLDLHQKQ